MQLTSILCSNMIPFAEFQCYGRFCIKFPQNRMKGERHIQAQPTEPLVYYPKCFVLWSDVINLIFWIMTLPRKGYQTWFKIVRDYSSNAVYGFAVAVRRQRAIHTENSGFASPTLDQHISTFRGYRMLFSIRNPYINRFTDHFSIHS